MAKFLSLLLTCIFFASTSSCSLFTRKGKWGKNALWPIRTNKIVKAFKDNASSAHVWLPLAGAGLVHWTGNDKKPSQWASNEKIIYHDQENTSHWSDQFNNILLYEMYFSILLTSSMNEEASLKEYALSKAKGALVVNFASTSTRYTRGQLARTFRRERPNGANHLSFPSGHATEASSRNMLISKNLDSIEMDPSLKIALKVANTSMAVGTLWARIEGKRHYPSDVLAGYAVGSFVSGFIYDALMNLDARESFSLIPLKDEVSLQYTVRF